MENKNMQETPSARKEGFPEDWPEWVVACFDAFWSSMAETTDFLETDNSESWIDKASMSPAKIMFPKVNWKNPTSSGPAALGATLGGMERFIEKETYIEDCIGAIDRAEEVWPFLKKLLKSAPKMDELQRQFDSLEENSLEQDQLQEFMNLLVEHESDPRELTEAYLEQIQCVIDMRPMVESFQKSKDEILSSIRACLPIASKQPSHEVQEYIGSYNKAYDAPLMPVFDHWAPHEKVHILMLMNHQNVSKMKNGAVLRRWIVRLLGSSKTYNQRRIDKIRERLTLKLSTRGRPQLNTTE